MVAVAVMGRKLARAVTLIEVMAALAVLVIASLGALGYQYYAVKQGQIARAQTVGTRIGQLLLEDWKSTGGSEEYDATGLGLGFSSELPLAAGHGYPLPDGIYSITIDNVPMVLVLNWQDVDYDSVAEVTLRQLSVSVVWLQEPDADPQLGQVIAQQVANGVNYHRGMRELVTLSTYVRLDASGG